MEKVKPYLKYVSTIDFGKVTYKSDFEQYLIVHNLKTTFHERCSGNFFLKYFKFYMYEAQIAAWLFDLLFYSFFLSIQIFSATTSLDLQYKN